MSSEDKCFTFTWKIENFSFITLNDMKYIESPEFSPYGKNGDNLSLQIYSRGIPSHVETSMVSQDMMLLIINNFSMGTDDGILSEVVVLRNKEVVRLQKLKNNVFVLKLKDLEKILKMEDDIIAFTCRLHQIDGIYCGRAFREDDEAETKAEIHRECFKTTIDFQNDDEKIFSLGFLYFDIVLIILNGFLQVRIEQNEKEKQARKNRYLCGKFLLVATKGTDMVAFHAQKYFDRDESETEWISPNYEMKNDGEEKFYFSCDVKTNAIETGCLNRSSSDALIENVERHLRYVSATNVYPDILVRVKGIDIAAHQVILAARSSVFARLIKNNECSIIEIDDYDLKTVTKFLDFLYSDELVEYDSKQVMMLGSMAESYEVSTLAAKCISIYDKLKSNPSVLKKY